MSVATLPVGIDQSVGYSSYPAAAAVIEDPAVTEFRNRLTLQEAREKEIVQAAAATRQEQTLVEALQDQQMAEDTKRMQATLKAPVDVVKGYNDIAAPVTNTVVNKVTGGNVKQLLPTNPNFQGMDNAIARGATKETESKLGEKAAQIAAKEAATVAEATKDVVVEGTAVARAADAAKVMQGAEVVVASKAVEVAGDTALKSAGQQVTVDLATGAVETAVEQEVAKRTAASVLKDTGEVVAAHSTHILEKTGEKIVYKAADEIGDKALGAGMEAAAHATGNAAVEGAAHTVSKANIAFEVVNGAVKMGTGYFDGKRQEAALVAMYLSDLENAKAQGAIKYEGEKPDFQALRDLAKVKGWEGVEAEVARIDAGLGDAAIKAGTGAGFSAAGTWLGVTAVGALITGTGVGAPVGLAVGAAGVLGSVCVSMAGGQVVDSWLAKETGVTMAAEITHKLQSGKPVDASDVFKVYLADDEKLQKALNGESGHRSILTEDEKLNGGFAAIKSPERQLQVLEKLDAQEGTKMKEACDALATGLMTGVAQAKDLSTLNGLALQNGGAEVADTLVKAKAVEDEQRALTPETPEVANENIPPEESEILGKFTAMHRSRRSGGHSYTPSAKFSPSNPVEQSWGSQMMQQREAAAAPQVIQH